MAPTKCFYVCRTPLRQIGAQRVSLGISVVKTDEISRGATEAGRLWGELPKRVGLVRKSLAATPYQEEASHPVRNR
jgi:hypothetical protein